MTPAGAGSPQPLSVLWVGRRTRAAQLAREQLLAGGVAEVCSAPDVEAACGELAARPFALAIVDDRVIAGNRGASIRRLMACSPGLAVVVLTGPRAAVAVREALKSGAADCLTRAELSSTKFAEGIAAVLEGVLRRRDSDWFHHDVLTMFSHDLMTPLANILGNASLLVERGPLNDRAGAHIARILANAHHMHELLQSILTTLRIDAGKMKLWAEDVDVAQAVSAALERNGFLARDAAITIGVEVPPGLSLRADRSKLGQMLDNLITNAIKYSPPGTRVLVRACAEGDHVHIEVRDEGHGIPEPEQRDLFRKFSQTSVSPLARGRSTGLGLYITDQLARLHGGSVGVASAPGRGSTFTLRLPRRD